MVSLIIRPLDMADSAIDEYAADENPIWVANRIIKFLADDMSPPEAVDLSSLEDQVTLTVDYLGTYRNQKIASNQPWLT